MSGPRIPVNHLSPSGVLKRWLALGPFPNSALDEPLPDGTERGGLDTDYLKAIGGEDSATIQPDTQVTIAEPGRERVDATARPREVTQNGNLDLATLYPGDQFHVAYAHCHLESRTAQTAYGYFGSKDGAKVWVNGILVHRVWSRRRAVKPWSDRFEVPLRKGVNRILVKVENSSNEWAFILQLYKKANQLTAIREHLRSLSLELTQYALPARQAHIRLRTQTLPATLLPPLDVHLQATDAEGTLICTTRNVTGRYVPIDFPHSSAGFVALDACIRDSQIPPIQGRIWAYIGAPEDLRARIAARLEALDLNARQLEQEHTDDPWRPLHIGLAEFALHWLRSGSGADTDWDVQLLRDFESLVADLETGRNYLTERLGRLHTLRCEPSTSEFAPEQCLVYLPRGYGEPGRKWPLILFLSGAGAVGTDIQRLTQHDLIHRLLRDRDYPMPVVAPQCPAGKDWNARNPAHLDSFLDQICSRLSVDPERVVLTGLSMGARAAWEWASMRPDRFAAVVPVCGRLDPTLAPQLKDLPIWIWHGDCDGAVPIHYAELAVSALREAGAHVRYRVIEGEGHDAWDHAYNDPGLVRWMQSRRRTGIRENQTPTTAGSPTGLGTMGMRVDTECPWCYLQIECDSSELHRTLYLELIRLYGTLRNGAGLSADHFGFARVGEIRELTRSRLGLTLGLPLDSPLDAIGGLKIGRLPRFACVAGEYRGSVKRLPNAFAQLCRWAERQRMQTTARRRLRIRYINRDIDYLDAELQLGIDE